MIPPTINYSTPDPDCDLDYAHGRAPSSAPFGSRSSNSFGFGGHNVSLAIRRWERSGSGAGVAESERPV